MNEILAELRRAVWNLYETEIIPEVTPAPANIEADYSSNIALKLAKNLHKAPMEIAEEIRDYLESAPKRKDKKKAEPAQSRSPFSIAISAPGFVNFISPDEYLWEELDKKKSRKEYVGKTVICEFSDPNPFKVLHVGHLYTSIVGNAIANLFKKAGAKVVRANFGGDVGLHVAKTLFALGPKVGISQENGELMVSDAEFTEKLAGITIEDIGKSYVEGTAAYEEDAEAKRAITELNKEIYRINAEGLHDSEVAELYWRGRELSYEYFDQFYARIGVHFDKYYPESTVAQLGLEMVLRELENGVYEKSDGAVVFNGEPYGLHTRVFVNQEGVPTYEAKDVGLIFTKWQDYEFDKSVVITGNEQLDYMRVVLKSVEQFAPELVERTTHLTHGLVKLPGNEKMSSRKGNFLKAVEVLELVQEALRQEYDSEDFMVALAAVKYAFLKYKMGGNIVFDPKESVKMTGNSGPYLLYSCVRAKKILAKSESEVNETNFSGSASGRSVVTGGRRSSSAVASGSSRKIVSHTSDSHPLAPECPEIISSDALKYDSETLMQEERGLVKKIIEYDEVLGVAIREMAPHKIAGYLYELAQEFSRFYEKCPVVGSERAELRLKIVAKYLETMTDGLKILGIEIPEEM